MKQFLKNRGNVNNDIIQECTNGEIHGTIVSWGDPSRWFRLMTYWDTILPARQSMLDLFEEPF